MLKSYDTISGKEGTAYLKIDGRNEELFRAKSIEAKIEIKKGAVKCIGRRMEGSKPTGMKGTGTLKLYYGFPLFADVVRQYKETGKALYFDMVLTNSDAHGFLLMRLSVKVGDRAAFSYLSVLGLCN